MNPTFIVRSLFNGIQGGGGILVALVSHGNGPTFCSQKSLHTGFRDTWCISLSDLSYDTPAREQPGAKHTTLQRHLADDPPPSLAECLERTQSNFSLHTHLSFLFLLFGCFFVNSFVSLFFLANLSGPPFVCLSRICLNPSSLLSLRQVYAHFNAFILLSNNMFACLFPSSPVVSFLLI